MKNPCWLLGLGKTNKKGDNTPICRGSALGRSPGDAPVSASPSGCVRAMLSLAWCEPGSLIQAQTSTAKPKDVPRTPGVGDGEGSQGWHCQGTIHPCFAVRSCLPLLPTLASMVLLSLERTGALGRLRLGWVCSPRCSQGRSGRRDTGLIAAGSVINFPYFGSRSREQTHP